MINTGTFSIGRVNSSDDTYDQKIKITMRDETSHTTFLTVYLDAKELAMALTGASERDMTFELSSPVNIGKKRERKPLAITLSDSELMKYAIGRYDKIALRKHIDDYADLYVEPGWSLDSYLGSQNSFGNIKDGVLLNVAQVRYV